MNQRTVGYPSTSWASCFFSIDLALNAMRCTENQSINANTNMKAKAIPSTCSRQTKFTVVFAAKSVFCISMTLGWSTWVNWQAWVCSVVITHASASSTGLQLHTALSHQTYDSTKIQQNKQTVNENNVLRKRKVNSKVTPVTACYKSHDIIGYLMHRIC